MYFEATQRRCKFTIYIYQLVIVMQHRRLTSSKLLLTLYCSQFSFLPSQRRHSIFIETCTLNINKVIKCNNIAFMRFKRIIISSFITRYAICMSTNCIPLSRSNLCQNPHSIPIKWLLWDIEKSLEIYTLSKRLSILQNTSF